MKTEQKLAKLKKIISGYGSCLVAFSGGLDSSFLLKAVSLVLPRDKILAVTAVSPTYPEEELKFSKRVAEQLGIRHKIINTHELKNKRFVSNSLNRCYFCKSELFSRLKEISKRYKLNYVLDATNISDKSDFRPGNKAIKELGINSPLLEAGLTKEDIRKLSKKLGLISWNKPSQACLASRIPYGTRISRELLERIKKAERYLHDLGFCQVRLRHYNGLCRIEVLKSDIPKLFTRSNQIIYRLKNLGYNYVTVDLEGYRTGSINEIINTRPYMTGRCSLTAKGKK